MHQRTQHDGPEHHEHPAHPHESRERSDSGAVFLYPDDDVQPAQRQRGADCRALRGERRNVCALHVRRRQQARGLVGLETLRCGRFICQRGGWRTGGWGQPRHHDCLWVVASTVQRERQERHELSRGRGRFADRPRPHFHDDLSDLPWLRRRRSVLALPLQRHLVSMVSRMGLRQLQPCQLRGQVGILLGVLTREARNIPSFRAQP